MNWYITRLIFRIISGDGNHTPQFDEQLKLIEASNEISAYEKATLLGKEGEDSFLNRMNKIVEWKFIGVAELKQINKLNDGTELHSKIIEQDNANTYISFIQQKNYDIQAKLMPEKTNI